MSLQSKILSHLRHTPGVWAIKVEVANERGCPDILCCVRGLSIDIEVKEGKDRLSPIQSEQIRRILDAGGQVWVVHDFDEFKEKLRNLILWCEMQSYGL